MSSMWLEGKESVDEIFSEETNGEDLQLAENLEVEQTEDEVGDFETKRELLKKTKIVRQTWSILEIIQKIKDETLILNPDYQRSVVWDAKKKTSFIESLYMEIMIPPIYVVEIPGATVLEVNKYEVVDGKQRLSAIQSFVKNELVLVKKDLEYYSDIFGGKKFEEIQEDYSEETSEMLSSVLDIYVITSNSPEFTKYDIFARLNKGAEKLKVNEIRRAIYHSSVSNTIKEYIDAHYKDSTYKELFSANDIKRFEDYGRFYKSVAFYIQSDVENGIIQGYNSRPREMINSVLSRIQEGKIKLQEEKVLEIIEKTLELMKKFKDYNYGTYLVDSCIPFIDEWDKLVSKLDEIMTNEEIIKSLEKSPATTSNVNNRLKCIKDIIG